MDEKIELRQSEFAAGGSERSAQEILERVVFEREASSGNTVGGIEISGELHEESLRHYIELI